MGGMMGVTTLAMGHQPWSTSLTKIASCKLTLSILEIYPCLLEIYPYLLGKMGI